MAAVTPDLWKHVQLEAADFPRLVSLPTAAERVIVMERSGHPVYVGLGRSGVTTAKGGYDLVNPGGGVLDTIVEPIQQVTLDVDAADLPTSLVDVYFFGGRYAERAG